MDKFELTKQLMALLEEHANAQNETIDLKSFSVFLAQKQAFESKEPRFEGRTAESGIAQLVVTLNKYAKHYFKVILEDTPIKNQEEFLFLMILFLEGEMTKTELFQKALSEKTTGMEMMKRLEITGHLTSIENPEDRRSKIVALTEKGNAFMVETFPKLDQLSQVICGLLDTKEKESLLSLLIKLDEFHKPIYQEGRQKTLFLAS